MDEIVLAYKPSSSMRDWSFGWDGDGQPMYEQCVRFYDTAHSELCCGGFSGCGQRAVGKEPYYDLTTQKVTKPPRIYVTHYPKKGEWENLKTVDDLKNSPLYEGGNG